MRMLSFYTVAIALGLWWFACGLVRAGGVHYRLARIDRLLEAGHGREARRVMAAVKRDVQRHRERLVAL